MLLLISTTVTYSLPDFDRSNLTERRQLLKAIFTICDDGSCDLSDPDKVYMESDDYRMKMFHLFSSGVPNILWAYVNDEITESVTSRLNVSDSCFQGLRKTSNGFKKGRASSFAREYCPQNKREVIFGIQ